MVVTVDGRNNDASGQGDGRSCNDDDIEGPSHRSDQDLGRRRLKVDDRCGASDDDHKLNYYKKYYPLLQKLTETSNKRTIALRKDGMKQMNYPKSNAGWIKTLLTLEGRALDRIYFPWFLVTTNAIAWTVAYETSSTLQTNWDDTLFARTSNNFWSGFFNLVLNTTMGFLLVFRLNRSATRFWMARQCWGIVLVKCRSMVGTVLVYGKHDPRARDDVIRWIGAFAITTMNYIRGCTTYKSIDSDCYAGLLSDEELNDLFDRTIVTNPTQYAADMVRMNLAKLFASASATESTKDNNNTKNNGNNTTFDNNIAAELLRTQQLVSLEKQLNVMIDEEGAMERIKGTPLPMVYVTHLRTWLLLYLLSMPYFWESTLGYATIPVVFLTSLALLGVEGAAEDVESPFLKERTNHLDMDSFCLIVVSNIVQQTRHHADIAYTLRTTNNIEPTNK